MASERYVIRGGVEGRERLRLLAEVAGPTTRMLLARAGVAPGATCLDVGCGGGDVTVELARLAGPTGRAVGVDLDDVKLDIARSEAAQAGIANVSFAAHDVTAWEPPEPFDVVYARFLLTHLQDPAGLLTAVCRHVRPGGVVIVEDIDFRGHLAEPDCPALTRYVELYTEVVRRRGADANIGPRLPGLLRGAGLDDVQLNLVHVAALEGGIKELTALTYETISEPVLADGLATPDELRASIAALRAFARDPHTVLAGPRIFQAWGRVAA
jgi:SAM-dependent methyltransferase